MIGVLNTRPRELAPHLSALLREAGYEPFEASLVELELNAQGLEELRARAAQVEAGTLEYTGILISSPNLLSALEAAGEKIPAAFLGKPWYLISARIRAQVEALGARIAFIPLEASLDGFETATRTIRVEPDQTLTLVLTLTVAHIEEMVVTAGRDGTAGIQDISGAVSAVPSDTLTRIPTRTIDQAVTLLPSVTFTQNSTFGQLSIRGIGTNAVNAGSDPSSAIYLDGVYLGRPAMAFSVPDNVAPDVLTR